MFSKQFSEFNPETGFKLSFIKQNKLLTNKPSFCLLQ